MKKQKAQNLKLERCMKKKKKLSLILKNVLAFNIVILRINEDWGCPALPLMIQLSSCESSWEKQHKPSQEWIMLMNQQLTGGKISYTKPSYDFKRLEICAWTAFTKYVNTEIKFPFNEIAWKSGLYIIKMSKIKQKSGKSYRFVMTWVSEWGQNLFFFCELSL